MTELVIACTLFGIGEDLVSLVYLLKLLDVRRIVGVKVGVVFSCLFTEGFFYLVLGSAFLQTKDLIVISFLSHIFILLISEQ